ncbi:MAG: hypothetical protein WBA67_09955 [Jannaschia sp.]
MAAKFSAKGARMFGNAGLVLAARVSGALLTLLYTFLLTGVAPPDEVGRAFTALSAGLLLSVVASLNVEAGSIRFLPLYFEKKREVDAAGFIIWCRRTVLVVCVTLVLPAAAFLFWWRGTEDVWPYLLALAAAPVVANARINSRHAVAVGLVLSGTLPRILVRPLLMTAVLGTGTLMGWELTATEVMAAFLAASCLAAGLQWILIRHAMAFRHGVTPRFAEARDWTVLGLMLSPMLVMTEYMRNLIIIAASLVLSAPDIARLGISLSMISVLNFAVGALDMVFSPRISRATAQDHPLERARMLMLCGAGKLAGLAVGVPLAWLLIPVALGLMGGAYEGVEEMFLILALIPISKAVFGPTSVVLNITGHKGVLLWVSVAGAAGLVVAVLVGEAIAGQNGATGGAALATVAYHGLLFAVCRSQTGIDTTVLSLFWERRARQTG